MNPVYFPLGQWVAVPTSHWDGGLAVDLFAPEGTPVVAVFDGVADAYTAPLGGNAITLIAADGSAAYYAHMQSPGVAGPVAAGQVIGYEGRTGNADKGNGASDAHLHFALASIAGVFEAANGGGDVAPWLVLGGLPIAGSDAAVAPPPDGGGSGAAGVGWLVPALAAAGLLLILFRPRD